MAAAALSAPSFLVGRTITVDNDGPADFQSIQEAIHDPLTVPGDVVSVAPGIYFENLVLKCGVSVVGAGSETTTVDGRGRAPVATISDCDSDTRLERLTLTNGGGDFGGGVSVTGGAPVITLNRISGNLAGRLGGGAWLYRTSATVSRNLITNNVSSDSGGGIVASQDPTSSMRRPLIAQNQISGNQALAGAGIVVQSIDAIVSNNLITGNRASSSGGGMSVTGGGISYYCNYYSCYPTAFATISISNNTIAGNLSASGGGLEVSGNTSKIASNVVYNNRVTLGGGGMTLVGSLSSFERNIFFLNSPDNCSVPACSSSGNLIADPLLLYPDIGDYRLNAGSPAIDSGLAAGAPPNDLRGQRRPVDGDLDGVRGFDRGAFEYDRDESLELRFVSVGDLNWNPAPGATSYHVYSGGLDTLRNGGLDTCRDDEDADRSDLAFTDVLIPAEGTGIAYLVTAVVGGVETSPAWKVSGLESPLAAKCPCRISPTEDCAPGCADGEREAFVDVSAFPDIAGCAGGFDLPGVIRINGPACGRSAGDDGPNSSGSGCNVEDLCGEGWHVCASSADVTTHAPGGCTEAGAPAGTFFVTRQSGPGCLICATGSTPGCDGLSCDLDCAPSDAMSNDLFGCGTLGDTPDGSCSPLDRSSNNECEPLGSPWSCPSVDGSDSDEAHTVVKPGPGAGGVLCCRD